MEKRHLTEVETLLLLFQFVVHPFYPAAPFFRYFKIKNYFKTVFINPLIVSSLLLAAMSETGPVINLNREITNPNNPLVYFDVKIGDEKGLGSNYVVSFPGCNLRMGFFSSWSLVDRAAGRCGTEDGGELPGALHRRAGRVAADRRQAALQGHPVPPGQVVVYEPGWGHFRRGRKWRRKHLWENV